MLEECGLRYNIIPVNINKGDQLTPEYDAINPNNRMPAIIDREAAGGPIRVFESGAILQYLGEKTGRLLPADTAGKYRVLQWVYWQDIAAWPWAVRDDWQGQDLNDYPNVKRWFEAVGARPAVQTGVNVGKDLHDFSQPMSDEDRKGLFNLP